MIVLWNIRTFRLEPGDAPFGLESDDAHRYYFPFFQILANQRQSAEWRGQGRRPYLELETRCGITPCYYLPLCSLSLPLHFLEKEESPNWQNVESNFQSAERKKDHPNCSTTSSSRSPSQQPLSRYFSCGMPGMMSSEI